VKKAVVKYCVILLPLLLISAAYFKNASAAGVPASLFEDETARVPGSGESYTPGQTVPQRIVSTIFVQNTDGTDDGVTRLVRSMQTRGLDIYQTPDSPSGLIASNDVALLKINAQWAERGGTNTDLIRGVIQVLLDHPGGFRGEIIVADNGQAQFGSERRGGSLSWANANSADRKQSTMDVIRSFQARGHRVTGARQINKIAASVDPVALDYWASKHILMPEAAKLQGSRAASMNPDSAEPGTFGYWLRLSMNELHKAGITATMNESEIVVIQQGEKYAE
jgi:hypothetical protein